MQPLCCLSVRNSKVDFNAGDPKSEKCYCTRRQELIKGAHKKTKQNKKQHLLSAITLTLIIGEDICWVQKRTGEKEERRRRENKQINTHQTVCQRNLSSNINVSKSSSNHSSINMWSSCEMWWQLHRLDQCAVPRQWSNRKWHLHSQGIGEMWNHLYHLAMVSATLAFKIMNFCRQAHCKELHSVHCTAEAFQKQK